MIHSFIQSRAALDLCQGMLLCLGSGQVDAGGTCEVQLSELKGEFVLFNEQHGLDNGC